MVVSNVSFLMSLTSKFDLDSRHALEPIVHCGSGADNPDAGSSTTGMSEDERHLLAIYHNSFNDDEVDHDLIKNIISHIQSEFEVRIVLIH